MISCLFSIIFFNIAVPLFLLCISYKNQWNILEIFKLIALTEAIIVLLTVTFFPIPIDDPASFVQDNNFIPFQSIWFFIKSMVFENYKIGFIRQVLGNIMLFFCFMSAVLFYFSDRLNLKTAMMLTIGFSCYIEGMQAVMNRVLQVNYRSVDIDDIILNTIGGLLAYILYKKVFIHLYRSIEKSPGQ